MSHLLKSVHPNRRRRAAFVLSVGCFVLAVPGMAAAATGVVSTTVAPVDEAVRTATDSTNPAPAVDTVEDTVQSVLEPVRDAAPVDPVDEVIDTVVDTVDEGTTPVTEVVDEPTKPVTQVLDETSGQPDTPAPRSPEAAAPALAGGRPRAAVPQRRPSREQSGGTTAAGVPGLEAGPAPVVLPATPLLRRGEAANAGNAGDSVADQIARAVVDASRAFRFPLLVAGALLLFLGVQGRLDSRDPKLAQTGGDEELMFA